VGLDPSLGAIMAARRAFQNERSVAFVCGGVRVLPFKDDAFRCVFSYSVLQHFSEIDAELALAQIGRVLQQSGYSKIQMAHGGGLRSTYMKRRGDYQSGGVFRVRYWSLRRFNEIFISHVGPTTVVAEAFGGRVASRGLARDIRKSKAGCSCVARLETVIENNNTNGPPG